MVPKIETNCGSQCRWPDIVTTNQPDVTSPVNVRLNSKIKIDENAEVSEEELAADEAFHKFWTFYTNQASKSFEFQWFQSYIGFLLEVLNNLYQFDQSVFEA